MTGRRLAKKVLLVGWDAADWQILSPLLDAGKMPSLNGLIERGVMGNIATLQPCLSPLLWTSIATGKLPDKHGILGFIEPDGGGGVRLSASTSRRTKAIWNILTQNGMKTSVIGWYASHPAEPINGVCVSNLFDQNPVPPGQPWPLPEGAVHPQRWREPVAEFRVQPSEIAATDMQFFIPRVGEIDLRRDPRPIELARTLAHSAAVHSIATAVMENEPWDFLAVYYDMLDVAGHHFMPYHPPRMEHVSADDFEIYRNVIERACLFHDQMLGRLLQLAGDDTTVVLVSDHGFYSDHRRPRSLHAGDSPEALAANWHRQFGVLCIAGDHIKPDDRIYGATLLDIAPTILMLLGIAPGRDMDGRPLTQILSEPIQVQPIASWEEISGNAGQHPPELRIEPTSIQSTLEHLAALGYIDDAAADSDSGPSRALDEADFNLAMVYLNSFRPQLALPILQRLVDSHGENHRYALTLAAAYRDAHRFGEARALLEALDARGVRGPDLDSMLALALFEHGETAAALDRLNRSGTNAPRSMLIESALGQIHAALQNWTDAKCAYERMLDMDPESPHAHNGLAHVLVKQRDFEGAASHALRALGIAHFFPSAHFHLGLALEGMGATDRAIQSLETCVEMAPEFVQAHRRLADWYQQRGDTLRAMKHARAAEGHRAADPESTSPRGTEYAP